MGRLFEKSMLKAARDNDIKGIKRCIESGDDVNAGDKEGWTPLLLASVNGNSEIVELLISQGADVNGRNKFGKAPLHEVRTREVAELLVSNGAMVNVRSKNGRTPLHEARTREVAEFLISKGADIKARDSDGVTPLVLASLQGYRDIADFLRSLEQEERHPHEQA
jgi:ankyrin repeat protein